MKKRFGFVSNSSSTSFVCNICGTMNEYDDNKMCCERGHEFCEEHMDNLYSLKKELAINEKPREEGESEEDFDNRIDEAIDDMCDLPEALCPCCNLSQPAEWDLHVYALMKLGMTDKELIASMQAEFKDLRDFNRK